MALFTALELDEERQAAFRRFLAQGDAGTYCDCIEIFSPGDEGPYFVHRFANPTYLVGQAILRAIGSELAMLHKTSDRSGRWVGTSDARALPDRRRR